MITGIHHFAIIVSSETSVEFYKRLGFSEIYRKNRTYDSVILLSGCNIQIEIFIDSSHPKRSNPEPLGIRHIALKVDDINRTIEELSINEPIITDWLGQSYCNITDPDGNVVELHE